MAMRYAKAKEEEQVAISEIEPQKLAMSKANAE